MVDADFPVTASPAQVEALAALLDGATGAWVLTGAGISTESGLPDYRGPNGLWKNRSFEQLANIDTFHREPQLFWEFYSARLANLRGARPNSGHEALAELERHGLLAGVVTQNVDGLHAAAGSTALEVHGTLARAVCLECDAFVSADDAERRLEGAPDAVPRCDCGAILKPGVVLFGELLPEAIEHAWDLVERCDLLLVCGSSLAVAPVGQFPYLALQHGAAVAIVNVGPTEGDHLATVRIDAPLGEVLPRLVARVLSTREGGDT